MKRVKWISYPRLLVSTIIKKYIFNSYQSNCELVSDYKQRDAADIFQSPVEIHSTVFQIGQDVLFSMIESIDFDLKLDSTRFSSDQLCILFAAAFHALNSLFLLVFCHEKGHHHYH